MGSESAPSLPDPADPYQESRAQVRAPASCAHRRAARSAHGVAGRGETTCGDTSHPDCAMAPAGLRPGTATRTVSPERDLALLPLSSERTRQPRSSPHRPRPAQGSQGDPGRERKRPSGVPSGSAGREGDARRDLQRGDQDEDGARPGPRIPTEFLQRLLSFTLRTSKEEFGSDFLCLVCVTMVTLSSPITSSFKGTCWSEIISEGLLIILKVSPTCKMCDSLTR